MTIGTATKRQGDAAALDGTRSRSRSRSRHATIASVTAEPASANAIPASRYRHRNQNGRARAFHSREAGVATNTSAHTPVITASHLPIRLARVNASVAPMAARMNSHRSPLGNRVAT